MDDFAVARVLDAAARVPAGRVATYGDLGRAAGVGPRQVGAILREHGADVPWWRIVNASGRLPDHLLGRAEPLWDAEGLGHADGRVALRAHRVAWTDLA